MGKLDGRKIINQLKVLIVVGIMILVGQRIGYGHDAIEAIPGMIMIIVLSQLALIIKDAFPNIRFPAFAWASLAALLLSMPFMPTQDIFLEYTDRIEFLGTTTPILAFAGISVGNKIQKLKSLSWKVFVVAIFVFVGTFFGSAIVAHIVLTMQGII
ncbi:hypothetical protein I0Q91_10350 [Halanaerobiaceae bacterium Z-7014]|uniref:DUF340 domain-containing protein n=1 Tax=Halonatronomonas betaini TaxID=2778430 RepID=A0A931AZ72_9FIRM|nr:hypothetical protein [Halonatronomonas betaini]MBF8437483.1 hypothetical protein [Halonatronomonas betaini]